MNPQLEALETMLRFSNYTQSKVEKFNEGDFVALTEANSLFVKKAWFSAMVMGIFLGFMVEKYGENVAFDAWRQVSVLEKEQANGINTILS